MYVTVDGKPVCGVDTEAVVWEGVVMPVAMATLAI